MNGALRVGALQYYIRPVKDFEQFADQVSSLVATAADYRIELLVFPEYFTLQLLTLGDVRRPMPEQARVLAQHREAIVELMAGLARRFGIYIVAGSTPSLGESGALHNDSFVFGPHGERAWQGKLHLTRWESEEWKMEPRRRLRIFSTPFAKFAVNICYDAEFPELARAAARSGVDLLIVPSCTDDRHGFLRVRYCAQARAIENQIYVVHSCTVGSLPMVPAVALNYGQASVLTPCDFPFARDGIRAEGEVNQEMLVVADLDLEILRRSRETGTVLPLRDSRTTAEVIANLDVVEL
ncbi:MAG: carbon-nitrogen hydrolase family protein [Thermoanaerobaculia bacterium]